MPWVEKVLASVQCASYEKDGEGGETDAAHYRSSIGRMHVHIYICICWTCTALLKGRKILLLGYIIDPMTIPSIEATVSR